MSAKELDTMRWSIFFGYIVSGMSRLIFKGGVSERGVNLRKSHHEFLRFLTYDTIQHVD